MTVDDVLNGLNDEVEKLRSDVNLLDYVTLATFYNLKLTAYEAGPDTFGPNNIQSKYAAHFDSRMQQICENFLELLFRYRFDLVNWFVVSQTNCEHQYGCWGLSDVYTKEDTPKYRALENIIHQPAIKIDIGVTVPGLIDGRQTVGNNFFDNKWKNLTTETNVGTNNFIYYIVNSETDSLYFMEILVSTTVASTKIQIEANNKLLTTLNIGNTQGAPVMQHHILADFKQNLNVISLRAVTGSFKIYNISVSFEMPPPVVTSSLKESTFLTIPYTYQILATNSPIHFSAVNLPTGLSLNTQTGLISGIPLAAGDFEVQLIVANDGGESSSTFILTVLSSLLLRENFEYSIGVGLNDLNGGYGFSAPWVVQNAATDTTLASVYLIQSLKSESVVTGGGFYLSSGRLLDVQKAFSLFKEKNNIDIGAGNRNLWISVNFIKYLLNSESLQISFNPQSSPTYSAGATRIMFGYFGTESNDVNNQNNKYWSLKYGDDPVLKSSKSVAINQMTTLLIKLVLNSEDSADQVYFYVNPNSNSEPLNEDLKLLNVNVSFRNLVFYAGSSAQQSSMSKIHIGLNYSDVL